ARTSTATSSTAVHVLVFIGSELQVQRGAKIVDEGRQCRKVALDRLAQARPGHGGVVEHSVGGEVAPPQVVDPFEIGGESVRRAYQHVRAAQLVALAEGRCVRGGSPAPWIL